METPILDNSWMKEFEGKYMTCPSCDGTLCYTDDCKMRPDWNGIKSFISTTIQKEIERERLSIVEFIKNK